MAHHGSEAAGNGAAVSVTANLPKRFVEERYWLEPAVASLEGAAVAASARWLSTADAEYAVRYDLARAVDDAEASPDSSRRRPADPAAPCARPVAAAR
jgi:hypothetical protein